MSCPHVAKNLDCSCDFSVPEINPNFDRLWNEAKEQIPENMIGVYVICFDKEIGNFAKSTGHAGHYIGSSVDVLYRYFQHLAGKIGHIKKADGKYKWASGGARILNALNHKGIGFEIVKIYACKTEKEARDLESKLKKNKNHRRHCPNCRTEVAA